MTIKLNISVKAYCGTFGFEKITSSANSKNTWKHEKTVHALLGAMKRLILTSIHKSAFAAALAATTFCPMSKAATVLGSCVSASQLLSVTASDGELVIASFFLRNGTQNVVTSFAMTDPAGATAWLENLAASDERENVAAVYVWLSHVRDPASIRDPIENAPVLIGDSSRRGRSVDTITYDGFASNPIPEPSSVILMTISALTLLRRRR